MRNIFIDSIEKINASFIEGSKYLSINEDIFRDHFPNSPMLPAAMMIETSIQLSRIFVWSATNFEYTLLPVELSNFRFFDVVRPGNILKVSLYIHKGEEIDYVPGKAVKIKAFGYKNNKKVFQGVIQFKIIEFLNLHNEDFCRKYLEFLVENKQELDN